MHFEAFSASELAAYLKGIPAVSARLGEDSELDVMEVGDGNLNYVYFVSSARDPRRSVVVKQAPPFLRLVGESWPLPRERMEREVAALRRFGALCPEHVPSVYHADSEKYLMVMQRLDSHRVLRQALTEGIVYPRLAGHISTFLARTLFHGSDLYLAPNEKKTAVSGDINAELCRITEDLVFTFPFEDNPSNVYSPALPAAAVERLRTHEPLRRAAGEMKWAFMNHAETLVHGDLHTGSIMANEHETYVIDPEFAFYGPMGFDTGAFIANLLLACYAREWHDRAAGREPQAYQRWLLDQTEAVWNGFAQKFAQLWRAHEHETGRAWIGGAADTRAAEAFREDFMRRLLADTLGFAGCKMIRRIVGVAKVAEITSIEDEAVRAQVEVRCLKLAEALLVQRRELASIEAATALAAQVLAEPANT
ncbi:S-methyl-5-thioribose kinase [Paraburkholderia unamae]|uniref:S-methyl-5-thioribose kinase n=1 Tax=Paraburkholderia unamae TaxID=219649 RepID=A0ABX5KWX6_9BURK|nr:S-methyl-5-thioribose kinase [Paraburkholderia unamae]PVX86728.1 5'-methylthioribose kinase [Paraburkholderia unamae]CAG9274264.1 5-methylthioribose kinase [Paraburkholderia unamae]